MSQLMTTCPSCGECFGFQVPPESVALAENAKLREEREELLHAMHDAAKFAEDAARAILEGVLHAREYGGRTEPVYRGNQCRCDHCVFSRG